MDDLIDVWGRVLSDLLHTPAFLYLCAGIAFLGTIALIKLIIFKT